MSHPTSDDVAHILALVNEGVVVGHTSVEGAERKQEFHRLGRRLMVDLAKAIGSRAKPTSNLGGVAVGGEVVLAPLTFPGLEVVFPSSHWTTHLEGASCFYYRRADRVDGSLEAKQIGPNHWCDYGRLADMTEAAAMMTALLDGPAVPFGAHLKAVASSRVPSKTRAASKKPALSKTRVACTQVRKRKVSNG